MKIISTKKFMKQAEHMPQTFYAKLQGRISLFSEQPFHPLLNNHALKGSLRGYRSINITGDWRVIYESVDMDMVRLIEVGTHHDLYGT